MANFISIDVGERVANSDDIKNYNEVNHPRHYNLGGVEVIKAIEAWGFGEGFNRGNAIKYIARAGHKDKTKEIEDLKKAIKYLEFEIERLMEVEDKANGIEEVVRKYAMLPAREAIKLEDEGCMQGGDKT